MPKKILIVEDDRVARELVQRALSQHGYQIMTAQDGGVALESFNKNQLDLILLDIEMPNVNGYTFITELRRQEAEKGSAKIPVVVLTTSKEEQDKTESFKLGVAGYMIKPVDYKQFVEVIRTIDLYWTLSEMPE